MLFFSLCNEISSLFQDGSTALILASIDDHHYTVRLLLKAGADKEVKDKVNHYY